MSFIRKCQIWSGENNSPRYIRWDVEEETLVCQERGGKVGEHTLFYTYYRWSQTLEDFHHVTFSLSPFLDVYIDIDACVYIYRERDYDTGSIFSSGVCSSSPNLNTVVLIPKIKLDFSTNKRILPLFMEPLLYTVQDVWTGQSISAWNKMYFLHGY